MPEVNGLFPTPTRRALLRAIHDGKGRIYCEASVVRDRMTYVAQTERVRQMVQHGWVRALTPDEARGPGETSAPGVTYYRLTDIGLRVLAEKRGQTNG